MLRSNKPHFKRRKSVLQSLLAPTRASANPPHLTAPHGTSRGEFVGEKRLLEPVEAPGVALVAIEQVQKGRR